MDINSLKQCIAPDIVLVDQYLIRTLKTNKLALFILRRLTVYYFNFIIYNF